MKLILSVGASQFAAAPGLSIFMPASTRLKPVALDQVLLSISNSQMADCGIRERFQNPGSFTLLDENHPPNWYILRVAAEYHSVCSISELGTSGPLWIDEYGEVS